MDGITISTFFLPAKSAKDFFSKLKVVSEESWAVSLTWGPVKVTGFPKNVVITKTPFSPSVYINKGGKSYWFIWEANEFGALLVQTFCNFL